MIGDKGLENLEGIVGADRLIYDRYELLTHECDAQTFFKNALDVVVFQHQLRRRQKLLKCVKCAVLVRNKSRAS